MIRIAIITYHRAINYGAVLQTYALATYLQDMGYEVDILDYRSEGVESSYRSKFEFNLSSLKGLVLEPFVRIKKRNFYKFIKTNLKLTRPLYTLDDLHNIAEEYDYIITGSDQVWNERWSKRDGAYLLEFCPSEKKISYAASIGKSVVSQDEKKWLEDGLRDFKKISVREKTGKQILNEFLQNEVSVNCDPVALIDKNKWSEIAKCPKENNYILIYMLVPSEKLVSAAKELANKMGKKVIIINDNIRRRYDVLYKRFISPEYFVGLFQNADYVFTNSFHGTMFSVVFEKQVYVELQKYKGAPNSRFLDLLESLAMTRCVINEDNIEYDGSIKTDYSQVRKKIDKMQEDTRMYFYDAFNS